MNLVVIIGLGYIGLPTSALIAKNKIQVLGVDINEDVVDTINKGKIHIVEPELENVVKKAVESGFLKASKFPQKGDVYLIVVPTPFKSNHEPDISFIESATKEIIPILKKNDLYIIESTSPVGTTEKMKDLIYNSRPDLVNNIYIAYCPERVLPGNVLEELIHNDRIVGGINKESSSKAAEFYKKFVKGKIHITDSKTAEMCKLTENASRDVQIAFANELSIICDKADINVWELINLANMHPRVSILQPGCGVGGHCIAVDPYFIISEYKNESRIISQARKINNYKPEWCLDKILDEIKQFKKQFNRNPIIGIYGLAFKPNIDDLRESPALSIALKLLNTYTEDKLMFVEPNISFHNKIKISTLGESLEKIDVGVILVGHKEFKNINIRKENIKWLNFVNI
ncbi:UDP-N-acetyl-D-mannosamine dehydrogenase [Nonlabens sp.]|uniref:UDP-N-acetyl-D-mannosamine dehydrogenase n=1 Tax=Nonlabens sp. TaxID=1888209 RepID=UPI001BD0B216|nr:UDP-N-acetyl-D-mannosamine dehydrogenase [Nonlabens sp.]